MRERPILFNGAMVRAILAGQKTQTRRVIKPQPDIARSGDVATGGGICALETPDDMRIGRLGKVIRCPYGQPGDRLWVRESWRIGAWDADEGAFALDYCDGPRRQWLTDPIDHDGTKFEKFWIQCCDELAAKDIQTGPDGHYRWEPGQSPLRWRPSIHMPRWASRITLEITGVRVERLQAISEADAVAEGLTPAPGGWWSGAEGQAAPTPQGAYALLWEQINGPGAWDANPWVWVVEFQRTSTQEGACIRR